MGVVLTDESHTACCAGMAGEKMKRILDEFSYFFTTDMYYPVIALPVTVIVITTTLLAVHIGFRAPRRIEHRINGVRLL